MKKLSKIVAVISMTALAFTTFGCSNNSKYEAEKNIQSLCPELKKSIKKDVKSEEDANELIVSLIQETMAAFATPNGKRATAKKPEAAKKQISKFYDDIMALEDCIDDEGNLVKDMNFKGSLDIANLGFSDSAEVVLQFINDQKFKRIDDNNKKYPTPESKAKAKAEKEMTVDKLKKELGDDTFELLDDSITMDRLYVKADVSIKDKSGDKQPDYINTKDEAMIAASIKNFAEIIQIAEEKENDSKYYCPLKAIAISEEFDGKFESDLAIQRNTTNFDIAAASMATDTQLALAAVNSNGLGAYLTIELDSSLDKANIESIITIITKLDTENMSSVLSSLNSLSTNVGKIKFTFNNGKKNTYEMEKSIEEIMTLAMSAIM